MKNGCDRELKNEYGVRALDKARTLELRHIADFIGNYPKTERKFPKFRARLDIEKKMNQNPLWRFLDEYKLYTGQPIKSPYNNLKGDYHINLVDSKALH